MNAARLVFLTEHVVSTLLTATLRFTSGCGVRGFGLDLLIDLLTASRLTRTEKSFNELAFAGQDEAGKSFEPLAFGHVSLGSRPAVQHDDLVG